MAVTSFRNAIFQVKINGSLKRNNSVIQTKEMLQVPWSRC